MEKINIRGATDILSREEKSAIHNAALALLEDPGFRVENAELLNLFEGFGATVNHAEQRVCFPRKLVETFISDACPQARYEDGMECSCCFPDPTRPERCGGIEATAGTYPHLWMDVDGNVGLHNVQSVVDATRLADALPGYDRLGVMGSPSDRPAAVGPLYMRLYAWKHAVNKLSNSGEVRSFSLIPYIVEMGRIMADYKKCSLRRYAFAEVELIPPWQFRREEAEIFVKFWKQGLLCGISSMISAGGTGPVTLAGVIAMIVAESLFISMIYRLCYGWRNIYIQCNSGILDMRTGIFPFGRPERGLLSLAAGSMAKHYHALLWASAISVDAKKPSTEAGYQAMLNVMSSLFAGSLGLECFGLLSSAEYNSAEQLVLDSEMLCAVKRMVRGLEVNEETLALGVIREVGAGGIFTDHDHTVKHFRNEIWDPSLFSRIGYNAWKETEQKIDVDFAREKARQILRDHHPCGIDQETEQALLAVVHRAEKELLA